MPVSVARKVSRPSSATLISGSLYALLDQHVGSTEGESGFFIKNQWYTACATGMGRSLATKPRLRLPCLFPPSNFPRPQFGHWRTGVHQSERIGGHLIPHCPQSSAELGPILHRSDVSTWVGGTRGHNQQPTANVNRAGGTGRPSGNSRSLTVNFPGTVAHLPGDPPSIYGSPTIMRETPSIFEASI